MSVELETFLEARGKRDQLAEIRKISDLINFAYVRQGEPLGLGHAVLVTRELVGDEPFAVILADDVIDADPPAIKQLIDVFEPRERSGAGGRTRPARDHLELRRDRPDRRATPLGNGIYQVRDLVEKPPVDEAPSDLAIIGRYILTPDIFPALAATQSDRTGEIQLTNGLRELLKKRPIYACEVKGVRHDTGNKLGFLKAVVYFALRRPDLAEPFTAYLDVARPASARRALNPPCGDRVGQPSDGEAPARPTPEARVCRVLPRTVGSRSFPPDCPAWPWPACPPCAACPAEDFGLVAGAAAAGPWRRRRSMSTRLVHRCSCRPSPSRRSGSSSRCPCLKTRRLSSRSR